MKKVLLFWAVAAMTIVGCQPQKNTGSCHVSGMVPDSVMEGQRIVIEPLDMSTTLVKSDTVVVKEGKFETSLDSLMIYKVMPADGSLYSVLQPIIIVGEPGEVWVKLGVDSHSGGTVQNDTLENWKVLTEAHSHTYTQLRATASQLASKGDTAQAVVLQKQADSLHVVYTTKMKYSMNNHTVEFLVIIGIKFFSI